MDFDDENSNKILKTHSEREMAMQDELSAVDEKKRSYFIATTCTNKRILFSSRR